MPDDENLERFFRRCAFDRNLEESVFDLYGQEWAEYIAQYIPRYAEIEAEEFLGIKRRKRGTKSRQLAEDIDHKKILRRLESIEREKLYRNFLDMAWLKVYGELKHYNFGRKELKEAAISLKNHFLIPNEFQIRFILSQEYDCD